MIRIMGSCVLTNEAETEKINLCQKETEIYCLANTVSDVFEATNKNLKLKAKSDLINSITYFSFDK